MLNRPKILIAPLDWGIGHATRVIPIIKFLIHLNLEVIIAVDEPIRSLLQQEFPKNLFILLKGYNITYSKQKKWLSVKIISQIPKILISIYQEHKWIKKVAKTYNIDGIISDNRFGLFHRNLPCAYITHQLVIKTGNKYAENTLQTIHNWFIKRYTYCWIPDYPSSPNIAGKLSHPDKNIPLNVKYIGALSRFNKLPGEKFKYDILILISGPEPQRSIFENLILSQLQEFAGEVLIVRGLPQVKNATILENGKKNIHIKNHLSANDLNLAINNSQIIICRSGYTSIMDLIKLQKKAILVSTPGQTEQEYLAQHLMQQKIFYSVDQNNFLLPQVLEQAKNFDFSVVDFDMELFKKPVLSFVKSLDKKVV